MGELPYMVVCLAEVRNNVGWKPTHRHRQTHTSKRDGCGGGAFTQMMQTDDIGVLINLSEIFDLSIQR